ncbi:MAG: hypothetical protein WC057_05900 [Dehalococcoidales bacterium]|jgi:predicted RNA-binding Zn-ribbon protein involved in translation (DUF1610 family)
MSTKRLSDIETNEVQLEVYECECGFHIGFDATYIEQVAATNICVFCPACGKQIASEFDAG